MQWDPRLDARGVKLHKAIVAPGEYYWRIVLGKYLLEPLPGLGGRDHIYYDVRDEQDKRMIGIAVKQTWQDGSAIQHVEAKPGEPAGGAFVMTHGGNTYGLEVGNGLPSDRVTGMGTGRIETPDSMHDLSYFFVFRRTIAEGDDGPTEPTMGFDDIQRNLQGMRALIDDTERMILAMREVA